MNTSPRIPRQIKSSLTLERETGGVYNDDTGMYDDGTVANLSIIGAVLPLVEEDMKYDINGTWTARDKKLYYDTRDNPTIDPVPQDGEQIVWSKDGQTYTVKRFADYDTVINNFKRYVMIREGHSND